MSQSGPRESSPLDRSWPAHGLEAVDRCPYCESPQRFLAHADVQDWSFYSAPGKWAYWSCARCESLYLDPRPTPSTLSDAYGTYYTHQASGARPIMQRLKARLTNESWSHSLRADIRPRLHIPAVLRWLIAPVTRRLGEPFVLAELTKLPTGRLMDVGCGNGAMLAVAASLGWRVAGLELDPAAVDAAQASGLNVLQGSYERLTEYGEEFDCIICSHVLEHVPSPKDLLTKLQAALKSGGTLLLALPNATSVMRTHFGDDWRGLEAPRHLSIPSMRQLQALLMQMGFRVSQREHTRLWTAAESLRLRRRGRHLTTADKRGGRRLARSIVPNGREQFDFIEFVCRKPATDRP
jgi:2-polyprenyl-3-methyl-5-hydroxy-6-metoxy-1,4-benzoquinol methylase